MKSKKLTILTITLISLSVFSTEKNLFGDSKDDDQPRNQSERNEKQKEEKQDRPKIQEPVKQEIKQRVIKQDRPKIQEPVKQEIKQRVIKQDRPEIQEPVKQEIKQRVIKQDKPEIQEPVKQEIKQRVIRQNRQDRPEIQETDKQEIKQRVIRQDRPEIQAPVKQRIDKQDRDEQPVQQRLQQIKQKRFNRHLPKETQENFRIILPQRIQSERRDAIRAREKFRHHNPDHSNWFSRQFFERHHYSPAYQYRRDNWSRRAGWRNVTLWLGWNSAPIYYNDQGYSIILSSHYDNSNQEQFDDGDWLPMGIFALGKDIQDASVSNLYLELYINKKGYLSGTYYNADKDLTYQLDGLVDKDTQMAAWKFSDIPDSPLMTTGIYNLTQDIAPVVIYMNDGTEQNDVLININQEK